MDRATALEELRRMAASIAEARPDASAEAAAARLLQRVSGRVDALELRAVLAELGALVVAHPMGAMILEQ